MNAQEIMTAEVVTVHRTESLAKAMALLAELDVRHLPVVDDHGLVGMLSDRDLREVGLHQIADDGNGGGLRRLQETAVADAMHTDVMSIHPGSTVPEIIELMVEQKVGALPVVEEHTSNLVGIVSYVDVLEAAAEALAD